MKQYCRYCAHCVASLDEYAWCEEKQREMSLSSAKRPNSCGKFLFNEIDAFDIEKTYSPRVREKRESSSDRLF